MMTENMEFAYQIWAWGALTGACLFWGMTATILWLFRYKQAIRAQRFIADKNLHKAYDEWELNYTMERKAREE